MIALLIQAAAHGSLSHVLILGESVDPQAGLVLDTGEPVTEFCSPGYVLESTN